MEHKNRNVAIALMEALMLMGQEHSDMTINLILNRLEQYPEEQVIASLKKCELRCRRIYLADIIEHLTKKARLPL